MVASEGGRWSSAYSDHWRSTTADAGCRCRGPRQRALLASLLLRAGEIVPEDRLLDEVWRGEPPPSGGAALRVRISQLRKALAATGSPPALTTRAPGYVLEVDAAQVDALRFERLLGEGRTALADGDPAAAAATLREALELWRGPALAEFADDPFAAAESGRLEELRIEAVEERVEGGARARPAPRAGGRARRRSSPSIRSASGCSDS